MATAFFLAVHYLILMSYIPGMTHRIDCSNLQCHNTFINCRPHEDCHIPCTETQSCFRSVVNCPIHGDCNVRCETREACAYIVIDAALSSGLLNVTCDDTDTQSSNHCKGMKIYGSTLPTHYNDIHITCNGHYSSCIQSQIHCAKHGHCTVSCDGNASCKYTTVTGPLDGDLNIHCNGDSSCYMSHFQGDTASALRITGCTEYNSCALLSLHCPPNTNDIKNCFIEGNDNLGKGYSASLPQTEHAGILREPLEGYTDESHDKSVHHYHAKVSIVTPTASPTRPPTLYNSTGVVIFAKNGWKDVEIEYSGTFGELHDGTMVCGEDYGVSCGISPNEWTCAESDAYCNDADGVFTMGGNRNRIEGEITHIIIVQPPVMDATTVEEVEEEDTWGAYNGKLALLVIVAVTIVCCCALVKWLHSRKDDEDRWQSQEGGQSMMVQPVDGEHMYPYIDEFDHKDRDRYSYDSSDFDVVIA